MKAETIRPNHTTDPGQQNEQQSVMLKLGEKYCLTVDEAAAYFEIGPKKLRSLADAHPGQGIFTRNGAKLLVIRPEFEKFLSESEEI